MKITLNFNEKQTQIFKEFMETGLAALNNQRDQISAELERTQVQEVSWITESTPSPENERLLDYLHNVVFPQQLVVIEILEALEKAEHPIIQQQLIY